MDYKLRALLCVFLLHFKAYGSHVAGKELPTPTKTEEKQHYGPLGHTIIGPDVVTVGVPSSFVCLAQCSPECSYTISMDDQSLEHKELAFTLKLWEENFKTVTCTAKNLATGSFSTVKKMLNILEGPVNVSISGPPTLTPGKTQRFLCSAHCRPFCTYTWVVDGDAIGGLGDEVVFTPPPEATSGTLVCKATNSMSGLFAAAVLKLIVPTVATDVETDVAGKETLHTYHSADPTYGPKRLTIYGPDAVTVGVPCSFVCLARCSPECNYTIRVDDQIVDGNELDFTVEQWEKQTKTVTCTAKNPATGQSDTISKTLQILEGPVNVSISGPLTLTSDETRQFLCTATCRPSCRFTWVVDGEPVAGFGNEVFLPSAEAISATLICKATNSVSGLFVTAIHKPRVSKNHVWSSSKRVELLPKLLLPCTSILVIVIILL